MIITKLTPFTKEEIENNNKIALGSLAMDLNRVAMGYQRGSIKMAEVFMLEAMKRKEEVDLVTVKPYIRDLLSKLEEMKNEKDKQKVAEDALMYSTLFQNAALK